MSYKKFVLIFIFINLLILFSVALFNYIIDPAGMYNDKKVEIAIEYLKNNKAITKMNNFDERKLKKELILNTQIKPKTIVLGSSRTMGIIKKYDKAGNTFANYSVSGASFDPDIALLYLYIKKYESFPDKVLIEVAPWSLNEQRGTDSRNSLQFDYYNGLMMIGINDGINKIETGNINFQVERLKALVSLDMFRASLRNLKNKDFLPIEVGNDYDLSDVILPDGSIKYSKYFNSITEEESLKAAKEEINNKHLFQLKNFLKISNYDVKKFVNFVDFLTTNNVEVILYFSPYHPLVYDYMNKAGKYKNVFKAEKIFLDTARNKNLQIIGSYDPNKCGLNGADFADDKHLKTSGYEKIFKNKF